MVDELATRIRARREDLGLSRAELAELVGRAPSTVGAWEQGRSRPAPEAMETLVGVLGLDEPGADEPGPSVAAPELRDEPSPDRAPMPQGQGFLLDLTEFEDVVEAVEASAEPVEGASSVEDVAPAAEESPEPVGVDPSLEQVKEDPRPADASPMTAPRTTPTTVVVGPTRRRAAREASRVGGPATVGTVQPVRTDADPLYRVRLLGTLAAIALMGIVFLWAAAEAGSAVREVVSVFLAPFSD